MTTCKCNNLEFEIGIYDDFKTIIKRYCVNYHNIFGLPIQEHHITVRKQPELEYPLLKKIDLDENVIYDVFVNLPLQQLILQKEVIQKKYSIYNFNTIINYYLLYVIKNKLITFNMETIKLLREQSINYYANEIIINKTLDTFKKDIIKKKNYYVKNIKDFDKLISKLIEFPMYKYGAFEIDEFNYIYNFQDQKDLYKIFNNLHCSQLVPFACKYSVASKSKIFKIYTDPIDVEDFPPNNWIDTNYTEFEQPEDFILIKLLNIVSLKERTLKTNIDTVFTDIIITPHNIQFTYKKNHMSNIELLNRLLSSIKINLGELDEKKNNLKGVYEIDLFDMERITFSDAIMNDPVIAYFFIARESDTSILNKERFFIHFEMGYEKQGDNILMTLTASVNKIYIRLSKCNSLQEVNFIQNIFSHIITYYLSIKDTVKSIYEIYDPQIFLIDEDTQKESSEVDITSWKRFKRLKNQRPDIFTDDYSVSCQQNKQPYLATKEEMVKLLEEKLEGDNHKIMEYPVGSGDYYICFPREDYDSKKTFVYPGLQISKTTQNIYPCCFEVDQYLKEKSLLNEYLKNEIISSDAASSNTYILKDKKILPDGRYGSMPYNIYCYLEVFNYKKIKQGRQKEYLIQRFGVRSSPSSLLYCMESATNISFEFYTPEKKEIIIADVREKLSMMDFQIIKGETFDIDNSELKNILLNTNALIDLSLFIKLIEEYYQCNIFCINMSSVNDFVGDLFIPSHKRFYNYSLNDVSDKKYIILIRYDDPEIINHQIQFELVRILPNKTSFFDNSDLLIKTLKEMMVKSNNNFSIIKENNKYKLEKNTLNK